MLGRVLQPAKAVWAVTVVALCSAVAGAGSAGGAARSESAVPAGPAGVRSAAGPACGPASARTIASDAVARVYASGGTVDACATGVSHVLRLGAGTGCLGGGSVVEAAVLAGRTVAYALGACGVDTHYVTVNVRRLTDGRTLVSRGATTRTGVESFQAVGSLVVKPDGAVAWVGTANSIGPPHRVRQVERVDRRGFAILDDSTAIVAASLTLRGSTLTWRHGAQRRTSSLH
jgi:hypothetical protein